MTVEQFTPTSRWRQNPDGSWDPTRNREGATSEGAADTGMKPADILAGDNITVVANPGGTVTITGRDQQTKVFRQDFRPDGALVQEGDYWIRDKAGVDVTPVGLTTDPAKWTALGFGYPAGASASPGPDGMSLVWTLGGPNGQQMAFNMAFVDKHVYRVEMDVSPLTGAAKEARLVWAFVRDSGIYHLVAGQDTTLIIDIPWSTGMNQWVMLQSPDSALGGGVEVKAVRVLDVTNDPSEQYVYDDPTGWTLLGGGGGGGADEVAIQTAAPTVQPGPYPRLWVDTDEPEPLPMLPLAGGQMAGPLLLSRDPVLPMEPITKEWYDANAVNPAAYLPLAGGTMTGGLTVPWISDHGSVPWGNGLSLNDAPEGYTFAEQCLNAPHGYLTGWHIITRRVTDTYKEQWVTEGYVADATAWRRVLVNGVWSPWKWVCGGLPDPVAHGTATSTNAITATAWANFGDPRNLVSRFPLRVAVSIQAWMTLTIPASGATAELRASWSATGATVIAETGGANWGRVLLMQRAVATTGSNGEQRSATSYHDLAAGTTTFQYRAYRVNTVSTASVNYPSLLIEPLRFLDG